MQFNEEELKKIEDVKSRYPQAQAALLPVLWMIQEKEGWISEESMKYAGDLLHVPYEHVLGVCTFYTMFNKKPRGKYHLQICTNVSCMLRGGYELFKHASDKLGIGNNETTDDGMFTIEEVECLGSCGTAPMMQVNNREYYENLDIEKFSKIIEDFKKNH
ncbi:MAG: NAD(P)H-dependent oxidoreductase subunit E [Ignavibacteria bacterium]|jgi:NADH-quinone oxidoreductase E subunit|nr:NAD(P)H-dependent oxidoreductase subunit E [Ignavibacteria bacterium]